MSLHRLPGLVDVHVHLRIPGGEHKETLRSGTAAALAGGVTTVLAMPNTNPPTTDGPRLAAARAAHADALCDVGLFLGATDDNAAACAAAADAACGLKIYVNETFGPLRIDDLSVLATHFASWPRGKPIVLHAEEMAAAAAIGLGAAHGQHVHIAHVSRKEEIELIARAKAAGLAVSCEVAPHHLFLDERDLPRLGPWGLMRPPLARPIDREALWANLDAVDCIATDHAPHARAEKLSDKPPPGVPGLEATLPLMLTAVAEGRLNLARLVALTSTTPARLFGLDAGTGNIGTGNIGAGSAGTPGAATDGPGAESAVEVEIGEAWTLPEHGWQTLHDWSPFAGMTVLGRVRRTFLRGKLVYEDGRVLAEAGDGRVLFGDR
jgi:dihydroorotase